jgi:hypothetical protein
MRESDWSSDVCSSDLPEIIDPAEIERKNQIEFLLQLKNSFK